MKLAWLLAAACGSAAPAKPVEPVHTTPPPPTDEQLRAEVKLQKAWLGVELDHDEPRVMAVVPNGPGAKVKLQIGDELLALDGVALYTPGDLPTRILAAHVGDKVTLHIRRGGKEQDVQVVLEAHEGDDVIRDKTLVDHAAPAVASVELTGHVTVLDFWATWCGPCRHAMPKLDALHTKYPELRVVGITTEEQADVDAFLANNKVGYPITRDADGYAWTHYMVDAIPTLVVVDKAGVVRDVEVGVGDFDALEAKLVELMK